MRIIFPLILLAIWLMSRYADAPAPATSAVLPVPLTPVHGGNYRSAQLSLDSMECLLQQYAGAAIKVVIRLNGFGKDSGGVSPYDEAALCDRYGVRYYHLNAHDPSTPQTVASLMRTGSVWIHCKYGFDRTGAMVAYWLLLNGYTREQVIAHNGWEDYVQRKGEAYEKYYDFVNQ